MESPRGRTTQGPLAGQGSKPPLLDEPLLEERLLEEPPLDALLFEELLLALVLTVLLLALVLTVLLLALLDADEPLLPPRLLERLLSLLDKPLLVLPELP